MPQLRSLLLHAACRTDGETTCGKNCPHVELRHSPHEPARACCDLFNKWLAKPGEQAPFERLVDCTEAEKSARRTLGSQPQEL
jgi:hypothetical protein